MPLRRQPDRTISVMMVNLVTFNRKGEQKGFAVGPRASIIGRKQEADIRIPLNEVSRAHCEVRVNGQTVTIRDLGSSNGTFVNDQRVQEVTLKAGDRVRVGPVLFMVQIDGKPDRFTAVAQDGGSAAAAPAKPAAASKHAPSAKTASPTETTKAGGASHVDEDFDIENLPELDAADLSDFELDELEEISDSGIIDDVGEGIEEISESDLLPEDDSDKP